MTQVKEVNKYYSYELKDTRISIEPIRMEENIDTGMIEISGRGNESQLVTMTYYAPDTAVNARTGQQSGKKKESFKSKR